MARRVLGALLVALVAALAGVGSAGAQEATEERFGIREIDATDPGNVRVTFFFDGDRAAASAVTIRQGDRLVEPTGPVAPLDDSRAMGVVLLIDTSASMRDNGAIERAREAARAFVQGKSASDQVAVVAFNDDVTVLQGFTADPALLQAAIDKLGPGGGTSIYDGVVRSAALLERAEGLQPNILLLTDGTDRSSRASLDQAVGALTRTGTALFSVLLQTEDAGAGAVQRLAGESGGDFALTDDPAQLAAIFEEIQLTLQRQYVVAFAAQNVDPTGANDVTLTIGTQQATAEFTPGGTREGASALEPTPVASPTGPEFFRTSGGLWLALVLVLAAAGVAAYALISVFATREKTLEATLRPYDEGFVAKTDDWDEVEAQGMSTSPVIQRAVEATGRFAERQGFLATVETRLERANLPLRAAEAMFFYTAGAVLLVVLVAVLSQSMLPILVVAGLAILLPPAVLDVLARRRRKAFETLLPDTLQLLASTLRAGYSLMQGVEAVSQEVSDPMGRELRRVVTEARLGRPLEESLDAVADRMGSNDFGWAVMAIRIQREVGGNLSELLVTVGDTMTERERLRRDVRALTAEGRVSAIVLGVLPLGVGAFIATGNPGYLDPLFERTIGQILIGGAIVLMLSGFFWMKKIIEIEI
jgi:tight adherence protein B